MVPKNCNAFHSEVIYPYLLIVNSIPHLKLFLFILQGRVSKWYKTRYSNPEKTSISQHILHQYWYTCPITVHQNPQHRSQLFHLPHSCSAAINRATWSGITCDSRTSFWQFLHPVVKYFTQQTLPTTNKKHFFMSILCIESFCPQTHNRTLLFGSTPFKHCCHFDYWNQPLNMPICYQDCHETGLCCCLVIHIKNVLHPLQLLYLHLWSIYWLSLIIIWTKV
jgi:hypothetical protein